MLEETNLNFTDSFFSSSIEKPFLGGIEESYNLPISPSNYPTSFDSQSIEKKISYFSSSNPENTLSLSDSLTGMALNAALIPLESKSTRTYYISTTGSDQNAGTFDQPFATLQHAHDIVQPGDTIYMRGGVYKLPKDRSTYLYKNGTEALPIRLFAYSEEQVIIDARHWLRANARGDNQNSVINHTGDYWHVKGIQITRSPWLGYFAYNARHNIWENLNIYGNDQSGFGLYGNNSRDNLILNSDFHHNFDPLGFGQDADGLAIKFGSGKGNIVRGCRAFANSDDGFDLWEFKSPVLFENTWAYDNGYDLWGVGRKFEGNGNGFKLGGGTNRIPAASHRIVQCLAWGNATSGFDSNGNPGSIKFYNNTSFNNGTDNYEFYDGRHILRNNLSIGDLGVYITNPVDDRHNSWTLRVDVRQNDFLSLNSTVVEGKRVNGELPISNFLKLRTDSDLIDIGVKVRLPFFGNAPDLGAFEFK